MRPIAAAQSIEPSAQRRKNADAGVLTYEPANRLELGCKFNNLADGARCNWHDEAQPSTTNSRNIPAAPQSAVEPLSPRQ